MPKEEDAVTPGAHWGPNAHCAPHMTLELFIHLYIYFMKSIHYEI